MTITEAAIRQVARDAGAKLVSAIASACRYASVAEADAL